jgi:hypothetical protein
LVNSGATRPHCARSATTLNRQYSQSTQYSRIFLYHAVSARGLEPSTELLGLFDGVERPNLSTVEDTLLA